MYTHDRTNITRKVPPASCDSQILDWVDSVGIDHKIAVVFVNSWGLAAIPTIEELRQTLAFNDVDLVRVKPRGIARKDDGVCLSKIGNRDCGWMDASASSDGKESRHT